MEFYFMSLNLINHWVCVHYTFIYSWATKELFYNTKAAPGTLQLRRVSWDFGVNHPDLRLVQFTAQFCPSELDSFQKEGIMSTFTKALLRMLHNRILPVKWVQMSQNQPVVFWIPLNHKTGRSIWSKRREKI